MKTKGEDKAEILRFVGERGAVGSETLLEAFEFETRGGAAATLLRLHRQGHLRRSRTWPGERVGYRYILSDKGRDWLHWYEGSG